MQIKTITFTLDGLHNLLSLGKDVLIAAVRADDGRAFQVVIVDPKDELKDTAVFDLGTRKWVVPEQVKAETVTEPIQGISVED